MALKLYVIYKTANGKIESETQFHDDTTPPTPGAGQAMLVLDDAPVSGFPSKKTHKVDLGPPPALVERDPADQQAEKDAEKKVWMAREIGQLDATREKMYARGYNVTDIDAQIAEAVAEYDALP